MSAPMVLVAMVLVCHAILMSMAPSATRTALRPVSAPLSAAQHAMTTCLVRGFVIIIALRETDDVLIGTGICLSCETGKYGVNCTGNCSDLCETCDDGPIGTGDCVTCPADVYDILCNSTCLCAPGKCDDGIGGSGSCSECLEDFAGNMCDIVCPFGCNSSTAGTCNDDVTGDGSCLTCPPGVYGTNCDQVCLCATDGISPYLTLVVIQPDLDASSR